jgi:branched-subunit amino acid ABC-type transport system permease component
VRELLTYVVVGITAGSVYGLAGVGLVLTYRTSGVFNFAHGALATAGSYLFFELWVRHHVPWPVSLAACVAVLSVVFGVGLSRMSRRLVTAPAGVMVVATVGLLLAIDGVVTVRYGAGTTTMAAFLPTSTFRVAGVRVGWDQLTVVLVGIGASAALSLMLARTRLGVAMRGVVDDSDLLEITGFEAASVRRAAWVIGGAVAVLSGILIAPTVGLNPLLLTYLVVQAFGAAAIGRFRSLPITFVGGWAIGIAAAYGQKFATHHPFLLGLPASLPFVALFVVLVMSRPGSLPSLGAVRRPRLDRFTPLPPPVTAAAVVAAVVLVAAIPRMVGPKLPVYISGAGFVLVFLSLGLLVNTAGQVSLCHGAFVAVGAVAFSHLTVDLGLPWLVALVGAGLVAVPVGAVVALPAIRLSGVYLALATFAFAILMENLVYRTFLMFGSQGHRVAGRPALPGLDLGSDTRYFYVVVIITLMGAAALLLVHRSRLGRLLRALADSPLALTTFGTGVNTTLVLVFCISAFFAGVAGAVLAGGTRAAGPADYGSMQSLLWIAIIAISGSRLLRSPLVAAGLLAVLPAYLPARWLNDQPIAFGVIAVAAALLAANHFDVAARVKADLVAAAGRARRSPVRARRQDPTWRSPVTARAEVTP